jgi:hypothetical protein
VSALRSDDSHRLFELCTAQEDMRGGFTRTEGLTAVVHDKVEVRSSRHPRVSVTLTSPYSSGCYRQTALEREGFPFALAAREAHEQATG